MSCQPIKLSCLRDRRSHRRQPSRHLLEWNTTVCQDFEMGCIIAAMSLNIASFCLFFILYPVPCQPWPGSTQGNVGESIKCSVSTARCTISDQSRMAPVPTSPHASVFSSGMSTSNQPLPEMLSTPQWSTSFAICSSVTGCVHIRVFMA